ncbi:hypothetical protein L21SP3_00572 [Sedimentisphaera cyanobacteriorum]|uniref:CARDB domain-containing protein n=1 Tax=Sedimentisphaera cyanobacteriorum TaxID=1940790 RepID=A0A1Q2HMV8_9BACT|nr:CARDB domain-containing protein [Sedimentisphaera cyanobacteriorum]AQQ08782.1 hypothetical protein L21SP3_00572 [Sedimentisphaera cyanobacteriorum]
MNRIVVLSLALVMTLNAGAIAYSGGNGSASAPYEISTAEELFNLSEESSDWSSHFIVTSDLDLSGFPDITIGNSSTPFTGSFNGGAVSGGIAVLDGYIYQKGHTISNFNTTGEGLFGVIGSGGEVQNVLLIDPLVQAGDSTDNVGAVCGENDGGSISDCSAVKSEFADPNTVNVSGDDSIGGICGYNSGGTITGCFSSVNAEGDSMVGGIVGEQKNLSQISQNVSSGKLNATNSFSSKAGGIVGENSNSNILNCYSFAQITGPRYTGGIVGSNTSGTIAQCYWAGPSITFNLNGGGVVGDRNSGAFSGCLFDNTKVDGLTGVGSGASVGIEGKTNEQLRMYDTYNSAGFDFENSWLIVDGNDFARLDNTGYQPPQLPNLEPAVTSETSLSLGTGDSFQISFSEINDGTDSAAAHSVKIYYNTVDSGWDSILDSQGSIQEGTPGYIDSAAVPELAVDASHSGSFSITATDNGNMMYFRVYSDADQELLEFSELDNYSQTVSVEVVPLPELSITSVAPETQMVEPDTSVSIDVTIENSGPAVAGDFDLSLYYSSEPAASWTDAIADSSAEHISTQVISGIGELASATETFNFNSGTQSGLGYYAFMVDSGKVVGEADENNNFSSASTDSGDIEITVLSGIDLIVPSGSSELPDIYAGEQMQITASIENTGQNPAGAFQAALQSSQDGVNWTNADTVSVSSLAAGASISKDFTYTAPDQAGAYQLRVLADSGDAVPEDSESNNTWDTGGVNVLDTIDLTAEFTGDLAVNGAEPSENLSIPFTVTNTGSGDSGSSFTSTLYMSEDPQDWGSPAAVADISSSELAAGAAVNEQFDITLPDQAGTYYYRVLADSAGQVAEVPAPANEQNNWTVEYVTVDIPPVVDLTLSNVPAGLGQVYSGESADFSVTVSNERTGEASAFDVKVSLKKADTNWFEVASEGVIALAGNSSEQVNFTFSPDTAGTYQVKVAVNPDQAVEEVDYSNNEQLAGELEVLEKIDLLSSFADYLTSPISSPAGMQVNVPGVITNIGTDTALPESGKIVTSLLLSDVSGSWESSQQAASFEKSFVLAGEPANGNFQFTAPAAPGEYFLKTQADTSEAVDEFDETNNLSDEVITLNVLTNIDLAVTDYPAGGTSAFMNGDVNVSSVITNQGVNTAGEFDVEIYKSSSQVDNWESLSPADSLTVATLPASGSTNADFSFPVTETEAQTVYLRIKADSGSAIEETGEVNNWSDVFELEIKPDVDLNAASSVESAEVASGEAVEFDITASNSGSSDSGAFEAAVYISEQDAGWETLEASEIVYSDEIAGVSSGTSEIMQVSFSSPASAGTYYLKAKADNAEAIDETDEANNWSETVTLTVPEDIDLTAAIDEGMISAYEGNEQTLGFSADCQGNAPAENFTVSLYYSETDGDWENAEMLDEEVISSLAQGSSYNGEFTFDPPQVNSTYYLKAMVDSADVVAESDETNNWSASEQIEVLFEYSGGYGTEYAPYLIETPQDFADLAESVLQLDAYYVLLNDIDMTGFTVGSVGSASMPFAGELNGNFKVISNLNVVEDGKAAPFAAVTGSINNMGIENSSVTSNTDSAAGFAVELSDAVIRDVFTVSDVEGTKVFGFAENASGAVLQRCVSFGSLLYSEEAAGFVGAVSDGAAASLIENCYTSSLADDGSAGTFYGFYTSLAGSSEVNGCFWNNELGGQDSPGATGLSDAEMKNEANFTAAGWDYIDETENGEEDYWYTAESGYPEFTWTIFSGGAGTQANPFVISSAEDMEKLASDSEFWKYSFALGNHIDLAGSELAPIGNETIPFTGTFSGDGYAISGFSCDTLEEGLCGLFGINAGTLKWIALEDVNINITSEESNSAALAAVNEGLITQCEVMGSLMIGGAYNNAGAIAALNAAEGTVISSFADCQITAQGDLDAVSQVAGLNLGGIQYCYAEGALTADGVAVFAGFLAGINEGSISDSYTAQTVSDISGDNILGALVGANINDALDALAGCIYSSDTASYGVGAGNSAGSAGYAHSQMTGSGIYQSAGWDTSKWFFSSDSYPELLWQVQQYSDFLLIADNWLAEGEAVPGDFNSDGKVNYQDFAYFASTVPAGNVD